MIGTMSIGLREVFGLGAVVILLLVVAARVLMLLFWRRVRYVNPALWEARNKSVWKAAFTEPISKYRPLWPMKVYTSGWKSDWESQYGSLDDVVLDRLVSLAKGLLVASVALWVILFALATAEMVWSKFSASFGG